MSGQRLGIVKKVDDFEILILVLPSRDFEPHAMYRLDKEKVVGLLEKSPSKARHRGQLGVLEVIKAADRVWQNSLFDLQ